MLLACSSFIHRLPRAIDDDRATCYLRWNTIRGARTFFNWVFSKGGGYLDSIYSVTRSGKPAHTFCPFIFWRLLMKVQDS